MKFSKDCTNEVCCSVRHVGCATSFSWSHDNNHSEVCEAKRRTEKGGNKLMRSKRLAAYNTN
eukprot:8804107-Ditylum_brightwellii.AAC.1